MLALGRENRRQMKGSDPRMSFTADRLLLFGATGDLAQRKLLPSLCALEADGLVDPNLAIIGTDNGFDTINP